MLARYFRRLLQQLIELNELADRLKLSMEQTMSQAQNLNDLIAELDKATTQVANRMQGYADQLNDANQGLTADEAKLIAQKLQIDIDRLTEMGKDPRNPIPPTT